MPDAGGVLSDSDKARNLRAWNTYAVFHAGLTAHYSGPASQQTVPQSVGRLVDILAPLITRAIQGGQTLG